MSTLKEDQQGYQLGDYSENTKRIAKNTLSGDKE